MLNDIAMLCCRENELLQQQLKKYISAVQMLRRQEDTSKGTYVIIHLLKIHLN